MKPYQVVLSKSAEKDLSKLPSRVVKQIIPVLESLSETPRPLGCKN